MNFPELLGIIDAEYDSISDLGREEQLTYLTESFGANKETAARALTTFGL